VFTEDAKPSGSKRRSVNPRGQGAGLRLELVAAARDLLVRPRVVDSPSLRAVARASGVAPSAVYLHFGSAEELLRAVVDDQFDSLRAAIQAPENEGSLADQAVAYVAWGLSNPGGYQLIFESADQLGTGAPADPVAGWDLIEALERMIMRERGQSGPSDVLALRLWAGLHGIVSLRLHKPDLDWPTSAADEAREVVRAVIGGATGPSRPRRRP
jgi:AcrR family transcriptional regulator